MNRFVDDDEVTAYFAGADAVVLPYHRSSASSPASVAMANGLPLVLTAVGGLPEAVAGYEGAILVPPRDPQRCETPSAGFPSSRGRYRDPHSWDPQFFFFFFFFFSFGTTCRHRLRGVDKH